MIFLDFVLCQGVKYLHPHKLTWQWNNNHLKIYLLLEILSFQLAMFTFMEGIYSCTESMSGFVSGYRLEAKQCAKNVCTCDYGTAVTGAACPLVQV